MCLRWNGLLGIGDDGRLCRTECGHQFLAYLPDKVLGCQIPHLTACIKRKRGSLTDSLVCYIAELTLSVHRHEEFLVVVCLDQSVADGVHGFDGVHLGDVFAHNPHTVECGFVV